MKEKNSEALPCLRKGALLSNVVAVSDNHGVLCPLLVGSVAKAADWGPLVA